MSILQLYEDISLKFNTNPSLESQVYVELAKIVSQCTMQSMGSDEGYCFKFNLPMVSVLKLYKLLGVTIEDVKNGFKQDWGAAAMTNHMYSDPYYLILLLLIYYSAKENKKHIAENAMLILLFKIWNGRKTKYLKHCDKRIMRYVVSNMCTKRHLFAKYDDPLSMLKDYHMPTLLVKYLPEIKKDNPLQLQRLLSQAWGRIRQQWVINMRDDIKTGAKHAQGGILPMYMEAKSKGLGIGSATVTSFDEEGPSYDQFTTTSNREEIISSTSEYITMNPNPRYSRIFINQINNDTKVSIKTIEQLLNALHNYRYHDYIHDILSIVLSSTDIQEKSDVCSATFPSKVKTKVISSKNNENARKLQIITNKLLTDIFRKHFTVRLNKYSNVLQIQLRSVIIYAVVHNLRKNVCGTA